MQQLEESVAAYRAAAKGDLPKEVCIYILIYIHIYTYAYIFIYAKKP